MSGCRGPPPKLPWTAYFSVSGWRERYQRFLSGVKSIYTLAKCKRRVEGFELPKFKAEALRIYTDVNRMIAEGDRNGLRHVSVLPCLKIFEFLEFLNFAHEAEFRML